MAITKKENSVTLCYKNFCINANGETVKILTGVAFTIVLIASIVTLLEKK